MTATGSVSSARPAAVSTPRSAKRPYPPVRQVIERDAARKEHQEAEEQVVGRDRHDDRQDAELIDQEGVDAAEQRPEQGREREPDGPIAAAERADRERNQILDDRGRDREGDVDPAGDQHDQQPDPEDDVDGTAVGEVEDVGQREERTGGEAQGPPPWPGSPGGASVPSLRSGACNGGSHWSDLRATMGFSVAPPQPSG